MKMNEYIENIMYARFNDEYNKLVVEEILSNKVEYPFIYQLVKNEIDQVSDILNFDYDFSFCYSKDLSIYDEVDDDKLTIDQQLDIYKAFLNVFKRENKDFRLLNINYNIYYKLLNEDDDNYHDISFILRLNRLRGILMKGELNHNIDKNINCIDVFNNIHANKKTIIDELLKINDLSIIKKDFEALPKIKLFDNYEAYAYEKYVIFFNDCYITLFTTNFNSKILTDLIKKPIIDKMLLSHKKYLENETKKSINTFNNLKSIINLN